jgi:hypothetical protein
MNTNKLTQLEFEQAAFDAKLDEMMAEHEGEFILFRGEPVAYFPAYNDAYQAGLDRYGLDDVFIVSEVKRRDGNATSVAWAFGAM